MSNVTDLFDAACKHPAQKRGAEHSALLRVSYGARAREVVLSIHSHLSTLKREALSAHGGGEAMGCPCARCVEFRSYRAATREALAGASLRY